MKTGTSIWDNKIIYALLAGIAAGTLFLSAYTLFSKGVLGYLIPSRKLAEMLFELAIFFIINVIFIIKFKRRRAMLVGMSVLLFLYIHQMLVTSFVSLLYILSLIITGSAVRKIIQGNKTVKAYIAFAADFMLGSLIVIFAECIASLLGFGAIPKLRILVAIIVIAAFIKCIYDYRKGPFCVDLHKENLEGKMAENKIAVCIAVSIILTMLMLQAGRMNIAADYDSLHYGLRSEYILDNGNGIYENLGNVNEVYAYPKGLEILLLPLSGTASYGYILSFNLWMTVGIILLVYKLTSSLSTSAKGIMAATVVSCIPGIMNMGITAKTDTITLTFQLLILLFTMQGEVCYAIAAGVFSYMLKPTAPVFSTGLMIGAVLIMMFKHRKDTAPHSTHKDRSFFVLLFSIITCALVWLRTYIFTGYPITSIYTSIWSMLGFKTRYPFSFAGMPAAGDGDDIRTAFLTFAKRIYGLFIAPVGEDMSHVIIAWGSGILVTFMIIILIGTIKGLRKLSCLSPKMQILYMAFIPTILFSLFALKSLWQVDGNYFMLLYVLIVMLAAALMPDRRRYIYIMIPWLIFNVLVMSVTNWAGSQGFSTINFSINNVYDNREAVRQDMIRSGNEKIWDFLKLDSKTRVIAFGEQPKTLLFPCNVQSYADVTGSGGNVLLVKTLDNFKSYLKYANIDYIYVEKGYLDDKSRAEEIIRFMIEDQSIIEVISENGNVLFAFTRE